MTVVAWDGHMLAADKRVDVNGTSFTSTKIYRVNGALVSLAGTGSRLLQLVEWYHVGADPATYPERAKDDESVFVVIDRNDGAIRIRRFEATGYPLPIEDRYYADGAGTDVAITAMHLGKTAVEAVELAARLIPKYVGNGVDALVLEGSEEPCEHAPEGSSARCGNCPACIATEGYPF